MNLHPDRDKYATGYRWLDLLTDPYWRLRAWWVERRWWQMHARPGESWKAARDRWRPLYADALERTYRDRS